LSGLLSRRVIYACNTGATVSATFGTGRILSLDQEAIRRRRLQELATEAEAMATNPRAATYRAFERSLREVQELGVQIESETIIRVASAFMQRPHVGLGKPGK
jgi:hypothetical protein